MVVSLSLANLADLANKFSDIVKTAVWDEAEDRWEIIVERPGYDPDLCRYLQPSGRWTQGKHSFFMMPCISHEDGDLAPCCLYCRDWVPYQLAIREMIKYCKRWDCEYELHSNHPYFKLLKDHLPKQETGSKTWYSLVPQERLPFTEESKADLVKFCELCFNNDKRFKSSKWVVESGKHKSRPNLHIHALVEFKDSKNFRRIMLGQWKQVFPNQKYRLDWQDGPRRGIDCKICNTPRMRQDKITYMNNESKGSHENFVDLNLKGGFTEL